MWSSHNFRIASWKASADALIGGPGAVGGSVGLAVSPLAGRTAARVSAPSRHTTATVAKVTARDFSVVIKTILLLDRETPSTRGVRSISAAADNSLRVKADNS